MKNNEVAVLLDTIADLLDIKGENFFKVRAYRMAAQIIMNLSEDVTVLVSENRLDAVDGIGPALSEKITEYVTTGHLSYLDELLEKIPKSLLLLLEIPGLGPKKVSTLFKQLHIQTIDELKQACKEGKLRNLEGFGVLTEHNILRGIALREKTQGRFLLHHATQIGENLLSFLKKSDHVVRVNIAGSLRRRKETIGDIDILVESSHPEEVMDWVVMYPSITRVLMKGPTKTSLLIQNNVQVDIRVVEKRSYGSALQYFTGSKEHNVAMRSLALRQGFKLNEYGLFSKHDESYVSGEDEHSLYDTLRLQYIPPELRENRGEIKEALEGTLPRLVDHDDIKGDLHVHSTYSDGHESIQDLIKKAESLGYEYLGVSDHSQSLHIARGLTRERILLKAEEIKKLNKTTKIHVLLGTECDILSDGTIDYDEETLSLFDFVAIGIHTKFKMNEKEATERVTHAMQYPQVTFLVHPTCRLFGQRNPLPINMETLFETAVDTNTALEINSFPDRLDLSDVHVKRAKEIGVKFCIDTDAHRMDHMDYMRYGVATARRGWLEKEDIINTYDFHRLKTVFKGEMRSNG